MSFFDDDEMGGERPGARTPRARPRPQPRSPQPTGGSGTLDRHTLMVRRRAFAIGGVVLLIVIALIVDGCVKSHRKQALKDYNQNVAQLVQSSDTQVGKPFFATLASASSKSALDVEVQIGQLRLQAKNQAARAKGLSVPGDMGAVQRNLLQVLDFRTEALAKIASLVRTALGGQGKQATTLIAGDMEIFLASDVIYSQRVAPLLAQQLASDGIHDQPTTSSRFLPNLGWLDANTVAARITGRAAAGTGTGQVASGTHGHSLLGASVGSTTLQPTPTLNHLSGGSNPSFTVMVQNGGTNAESNVKVDIAITVAGKQLKASHVVNKTQPSSKVNVDIPVSGVPLGAAAKITISIEAVPGETNADNNKSTYLAVFAQ
ncbi:MAG TPA: hypothetical protein VLJ42_07025 [Solirubrobacteraceae bacterium]|nr:hypothetical protein [Solirubrobacteraceae bacterium]